MVANDQADTWGWWTSGLRTFSCKIAFEDVLLKDARFFTLPLLWFAAGFSGIVSSFPPTHRRWMLDASVPPFMCARSHEVFFFLRLCMTVPYLGVAKCVSPAEVLEHE